MILHFQQNENIYNLHSNHFGQNTRFLEKHITQLSSTYREKKQNKTNTRTIKNIFHWQRIFFPSNFLGKNYPNVLLPKHNSGSPRSL